MAVTVRKVLKYSLLPGIIPRLQDFFSSASAQIAVFMAQAYRAGRLLPATHPYLIPANTGRFGVRDVMAQARRNLVFRRENADQIILYYTIAGGLFLLLAQFALFALSLSVSGAWADSISDWWGQFFVTPQPKGDLAFLLLDHVFGLQGVFGSCADPALRPCPTIPGAGGGPPVPLLTAETGQWPTPFHTGLHAFFHFYNLGVACVGILILIYIITTLVGETAQSGQPFGHRFNKAWAVPRMMMAVALLTPAGAGFNGAQWITLYAAKWGSGLATNGWILFNKSIANATLFGRAQSLVVNPSPPDFNTFLEFMLVARACKWAEEMNNSGTRILAYQVNGNASMSMSADYNVALGVANNKSIIIRFGEQNPKYEHESGFVKPTCGEMVLQPKDLDSPGALAVQGAYYNMIRTRWNDAQNDTFAHNIAKRITNGADKDPIAALPDNAWLQASKDWLENQLAKASTDGRIAEQNDPRWVQSYTALGWGGEAIWYNRIAEYNGSFVAGLFNVPRPSRMPDVMEHVAEQRKTHEDLTSSAERFCPSLNDQEEAFWRNPGDQDVATTLCYAQQFWKDQYGKSSGSAPLDFIQTLFGTRGLFNMIDNTDVNPLAQLAGIGRSMIEAYEANLLSTALAGIMRESNDNLIKIGGEVMRLVSSSISSIALAIGFLLFYVLPFLPFIYVFFGLGGWVKAVFEAMVGLPLWALSHLRIDGEGIPGGAGLNGYFLIFEIFIRPILIVFGLLAATTILTAEVQVLNQIWSLVVTNLSGHDPVRAATAALGETGGLDSIRDIFDSFCFTILYAICVYIITTSTFKLIDLIPQHLLRWIGSEVNAFSVEGQEAETFMTHARQGVDEFGAQFNKGIYSILLRNSIE